MIVISEYHRVYTQDQRDRLEDIAKRWSGEEVIEKEFSFLQTGCGGLCPRIEAGGEIDVGLKQ